MCYKMCLTVINKKTYTSKEEMKEKLDVFLLANRISESEYNELMELLEER